jgi:uncharacterized membrane protein
MNASTNLAGFTFIVLTSLKAFDIGKNIFIDKIVVLAVFGFMLSTVLSFASIREKQVARSVRFELFADYVFFASLLLMLLVSILLLIVD